MDRSICCALARSCERDGELMMSDGEMQHLVLAQEGVAVAGHVHVLISVQNQAHRPAQDVGRHSCCSVWEHTAGLFTTKASSDTLHVADHLVVRDAQHVCNGLLMLSWCLHLTSTSCHLAFVMLESCFLSVDVL